MRGLLAAAPLACALLAGAGAARAQAQTQPQPMPDMPGMDHGKAAQTKPDVAKPDDMAGMDMTGHDMAGMDMSHGMTGAFGPYAMSREASGTAWQPDASPDEGPHVTRGPWMIMLHGFLNGVYDQQNGPRGDQKTFVSGMFMVMAQRPVGEAGTLQLRAMLSPDPLMGPSGYPLLLATGETADGKTPLVDRQHPHDLFMELSASYAFRLSASDSAFVYAGLPGEPAFGPPAFMHRLSVMDSPEAPISHHWLDSTHITFGVITAGVILGDWKVEASRFHGREPDQHRSDIETGALDSTAARISWNPSANWSLQGSWAQTKSPEQLEPDANQRKLSASAIYATRLAGGGLWSTTAAWGRRNSDHEDLDAWILESSLKPTEAWTLFARAERTENNELVSVGGHHGPTYTVGKASIGVIRDWRLAAHLAVGLGGLYAVNFVPGGLEPLYGDDPTGAMAFVRLKID